MDLGVEVNTYGNSYAESGLKKLAIESGNRSPTG